MRIVSWNIRAGGGRRLRDIADQLERWQPDVVALSEFRGTAPSQELKALLYAQGLIYQVDISDPLNRRVARTQLRHWSTAYVSGSHFKTGPKLARWGLSDCGGHQFRFT